MGQAVSLYVGVCLCVVVWREVLYWGRQPPSLLVCLCVVVWARGVVLGQAAFLYVGLFVW